MPSYEASVGDVLGSLTGPSSGLSEATQSAITALLAGMGTSVAVLATTDAISSADASTNATVITQTGDVSANVRFGADSPVQVMTVGSGGNSNVTFTTNNDVIVVLTGGEGDSVTTAAGKDNVTFAGGSATIDTGLGNDEIVISRDAEGSASIDAGDGFDTVRMVGERRDDHHFSFRNGKFFMNSDAELQMDNVNIVAFDTSGDGQADSITVLATSAGDALVARLYQVALGRGGLDQANGTNGLTGDAAVTGQLGGIAFWTDVYNADANLQQTVRAFCNCDEFHAKYDNMTDLQYVQTLFNNLGGNVNAVNGMTAAELAQTINGSMDARYEIAGLIASSDQAIQILGADGTGYVIDGYDGGAA